MFRKLRNKFLGLNMVTTCVLVMIIFGTAYLNTYRNIITENNDQLNNVANSFIYHENQQLNKVTPDYAPSFLMTVNDDGEVSGVDSFIDMPESLYIKIASMAWKKGGTSIIYIENKAWMYKIEKITENYQMVFLDVTNSRRFLSNLLATFMFIGGILIILIFFISRYFANSAITPIIEAWNKQKRFVADASHELKTPITTIMANCDVLVANEEETIKSQREWLDYIRIGAERMNKLIISLLTFANVEGQSQRLPRQNFDIIAILDEIEQEHKNAIKTNALTVKKTVDLHEDVLGYEGAVRQVVAILYENAVKYTNYGGEIEILLVRFKRTVVFTIKNTGQGISEDSLPYIFDRFFRADVARGHDENSYGLGLAIAKSLAEQIQGNISVKSEPNGITEFTFTFRA